MYSPPPKSTLQVSSLHVLSCEHPSSALQCTSQNQHSVQFSSRLAVLYLLFHIRGEDEGQITCVHKGKFSEFDESIRTDPHGFFRLRYSVSSRTHHIAEFGFSYQGSDCPFDSLKHIQNELTFPHPPQFCGYYLGTPYCLLMRIPLLEQDPLWITRQMTLPMAPRHMHADLPALRRLGILLSQLDSR